MCGCFIRLWTWETLPLWVILSLGGFFLIGYDELLMCSAGTGLLSMMAARAMGSVNSGESHSAQGRVTACESYLPMVKLMRKVLHLNGMGRKINVINKRSDELNVGADIPLRADVLVSMLLLDLHSIFF